MSDESDLSSAGQVGVAPADAAGSLVGSEALATLAEEVARLRRILLRQGHAQEMFQERVESSIRGLSGAGGGVISGAAPSAGSAGAVGPAPPDGLPSSAQQRAMLELDKAVLHMLALCSRAGAPTAEGAEVDPGSVEEGLAFLQIRVRNLQLSFGLEPVPAVGTSFDDRLHQVHAVTYRPDLADAVVIEEILPGYRLRDRLLRPALVTVNRWPR